MPGRTPALPERESLFYPAAALCRGALVISLSQGVEGSTVTLHDLSRVAQESGIAGYEPRPSDSVFHQSLCVSALHHTVILL